MQDEDLVSVMAVEDTAGWFHYLTITGTSEFLGTTAAVGVVNELLNVAEDTLDKLCRRDRILQRNVVRNCIKVRQRGLGPNYFSHLARRFLACAWVAVRLSAIACSPRAMPSRIAMRCCMS